MPPIMRWLVSILSLLSRAHIRSSEWYFNVSHLTHLKSAHQPWTALAARTWSYTHWGIGRSWGTSVASAPELDPWVSSSPVDMWVCSPRLVRTKERFSVRSRLRYSTSTYLLSKCQRWIYISTRLVILSINIDLVRTPIVYHCSEACNCENTSNIERGNFHSMNLGNSCLHEHHWLMATHLDRLRLWSCLKDWCQWVANLVDVWNGRIY